MDMLVIPISLVLLAFLAFQRWGPLVMGPILVLFLCLWGRLPFLETLLGPYMEQTAGFVKNFFLVFLVSAIFGAIMEATGAAESLAKYLTKLLRGKYTASAVVIITGLLGYGGVNVWVIVFITFPLALSMFKEANLSRKLIPGCISAGSFTFAMTSPGTPSVHNIIPMRFLNTGPLAAPLPGFVAAAAMLVLCLWYLERRATYYKKRGMGFEDATSGTSGDVLARSDADLPPVAIAALPPVLTLVLFNVFRVPVEVAVFVGCLAGICCMAKRVSGYRGWVDVVNKGAVASTTVVLNTAAIVGFAGVMRLLPAFTAVVNFAKGMHIHPLLFVFITVAMLSGAAGSASGGLGIAFGALADVYKSLGVPLEYVHRVASMTAGTLDSLPHCGAIISVLTVCGMTHRDSYREIFVTTVAIPLIVVLGILIPMCMLGL